jgi:hypothetical protein
MKLLENAVKVRYRMYLGSIIIRGIDREKLYTYRWRAQGDLERA